MPLVRDHGQPLVGGTELAGVLFRGGIIRQLCDCFRFDVDLVEIVMLVPAGVLSERDETVVAAPREPGAHRARHLAVADLAHRLCREVHHVELDPPRLIPVERHFVALPRDLREEERRQAAELLERYARLTAGRNGHGWSSPGCSLNSKQRARRVHPPTPRRRAELRAPPPGTRLLARALRLALLATRLVGRRRRDPLRDPFRPPARRLAPLDVPVLPLALCAFH